MKLQEVRLKDDWAAWKNLGHKGPGLSVRCKQDCFADVSFCWRYGGFQQD